MKKRFFICGNQRSGTTMMRLILDSHPDIYCFGELRAYDAITKDLYVDKISEEIIGFQTPIWTELFIEYQTIADICNDSPIIFMIRSAEDCVASMTNLGTFRFDWIALNVYEPMKLWFQDENRSLKRDFGEELEIVFKAVDDLKMEAVIEGANRDLIWSQNSSLDKEELERKIEIAETKAKEISELYRKELISLATIYWKYKNIAFVKMLEKSYKVLGVDYNDCCIQPRREIQRIMDFIGVPWHDRLLMHHRIPHTELTRRRVDGTPMALGNTRANRAIDTASIHRSRDLKQDEIHLINEIAGGFYEELRDLIRQ